MSERKRELEPETLAMKAARLKRILVVGRVMTLPDIEAIEEVFTEQEKELADLRSTADHDNELVGKYMADAEKAEAELARVRGERDIHAASAMRLGKQCAEYEQRAEAALRSQSEAVKELLRTVRLLLDFVPCAAIDERIAETFKAEVLAAAERLKAVEP